ncbi:SPOR domain-containing protein [Hymenobacter caeli]|uniref:Cell division protein FtsN/nucleoid DNA-binding protein n=1 Tax=Hymenobacter caeli TaxID=2735894 RepID=A0ABX2FTC0_9BACT|nr:SPOR domain-containing protein [Hymenobacter caeli]NRT19640.1 cell division protein FtsN/nucleoid DNA-binding protein [Hymenobacter caeli]
MHLADHIRPLLRDHDCVIIPDFGGLVADAVPARVQPNRHALSPPARLLAFNQSLTRNDGLLVDALAQHLRVPTAQAREALRTAVAGLQHDLDATSRTELPGIGIFRRADGRGLSFEYTGTDVVLPAAYGLPVLAARPVRAAARAGAGPRAPHAPLVPQLRPARPTRRRLLSYAAVGLVAGLVVSANYLFALHSGYLPAAWQARVPLWAATRPAAPEPQQAGLARQAWNQPAPAALAKAAASDAALLAEANSLVLPARAPDGIRVTTRPEAAPAAEPAVAAMKVAPVAKPGTTAAKPGALVAKATPVAKVASAARAPVAKVAPAAKAMPAFSTTIKGPTGRYYIVGGSFRTLAAAQAQQRTLAKLGHRSRVVLPRFSGHKIKVSIDDFADKTTAQREAQRMRTHTHLGSDLWVLAN